MTDIEKALSLFSTPGYVLEIRALNCWDNSPEYKSTRSGYFDSGHLAEAIGAARELESRFHAAGVYLTINPVKADLLARSANRVQKANRGEGTKDAEITERRWMLLDFDPKKPAGISSTDSELNSVETELRSCEHYLTENGWPKPVVAMSGNGWHLLYRVDLPAESKLVESCLKAVSARFSSVDISVHNASRITKLYGTMVRKGDHTEDRPHRRSRIESIPEVIDVVPLDRVEWLANQAPLKPMASTGGISGDAIDIDRYLRNRGVAVLSRGEFSGSPCWYIQCPGIDSHTTQNGDKDCAIWQDQSGMVAAKCFHKSCRIHAWSDVRDALGKLTSDDFSQQDLTRVDIANLTSRDDDASDDLPAKAVDIGFPSECLYPPGTIGDIVRFNLETARFPQPELALAGAIALWSLITGRRIADAADTRTNVMICALGPTRSGKEHSRKVNKRILEALNAEKFYEEKMASDAALLGFLSANPAGLLMNDEFGDWLSLARSKTGMNSQPARIITKMVELYSSSCGRFKGNRYAENSKQVEINQPHLVFYGTTTGEVFWKHITPDYLSGGLFGRMMLFENRGYVDPQPMLGRETSIPQSIISDCRWWLDCFHGQGEFAWINPTPMIVKHTLEARERYEWHEMSICQKRHRENEMTAALWSGTAEITAKLALLFASSRAREPLEVQLCDVDLAIKLSNWLTRRKVLLCTDHVAENAQEDATKRVFRMIKQASAKGIERYELTRKTQWLNKREREEIISTLIQSGQIQVQEIATKTKNKTILVAPNSSRP